MKYREVGRTGIEVSEVGFGTWELGGMEWGDISDADALAVLRHAYDRGITFYDTANVYGPGRSEELLGEAFAGMDDVIIATKVAFPMDTDGHIVAGGPGPIHNLSREAILTECDLSLKRLQRDTIDFYQMHRPPDHHEWDESFGAMEELRAAGKIRHYGVALGSMADGLKAVRENDIACLMTTFNCLNQEPADELMPAMLAKGVSLFARVPLASGFLTGTLTPNTEFAWNDKRGVIPRDEYLATLAQAERMRFLEDEPGVGSMAEGALKFVLAHEAVASVVAGMMRLFEVDLNVAASGEGLSEGAVERVREVYREGLSGG
ncbi:MAG: aldo/keto reductase [Chloroflexi bacterium]|nr:aldo/keto reductase [Chloroflexota bacterium]